MRLNSISAATIDRLLKPIRAKIGGRGLSGIKPGKLLKKHIPIQSGVWDVSQPGFMEADTVAHCGDSLAGDFVWSLTMTDICTGWTECRATWNKGADGVMTQIKTIQQALPFPIRGFDCDNGSEFLNWNLLRYFQSYEQPIKFARSRPYHSNDNAHVEQKNWSCVRQLFGYDRIGDARLGARLDRLGRSVKNLVDMVGELRKQDIQFKSLTDAIDTGTPSGRFFFHVMSSLVEMRARINRRTHTHRTGSCTPIRP